MKRDIIGDIFLGGVLLSLLFLFTFPAYFCFSQNAPRDISLTERLMSVFFVLAFILTCIWVCWKKKIWVMLGLAFFSALPYVPKWFLPKVNMRIIMNGRSLLDSILSMILNRIYELTHAPFTGLLGMVSEKTVENLPYKMLPLVLISYILSQIVRFYYNAYVTEKKQIHDFNHFRKANDIRKPAVASLENAEPVPAPAPLGTIVMNENAEIAAESFPTKNAEEEKTMQVNLSSDAPVPAIPADTQATAVIPLAAHAPTSRPAEETQVIALSAHAPTSAPPSAPAKEQTQVIALPSQDIKPEEPDEPQVIALSAHAPTSSTKSVEETPESKKDEKPEPSQTSEDKQLDFPDVHGEAEKIDVFGDNDLP
ncbi:MAG: hypothetical protein J5636_09650 [Clostridiales bacterium]|nr:hypothetical protein [Clostridiales bacterium]